MSLGGALQIVVTGEVAGVSGYVAEPTFEVFFQATYARVVRVLSVGWGDRDAVEDAAQEAFARALSRWSRVSRMERPDGWVYVTAANLLRRRIPSSSNDEATADHPAKSSGDGSDAVVNQIVTR